MVTTKELTKVKSLLSKTDIIESYTRERANLKLKFYKLTNVTVFVAKLKEVSMGCKDTVLPDPLLKNQSLKILTHEENTGKQYNDNLGLLRALALHLHENETLEEETSKIFNLFLGKTDGTDLAYFRSVCTEDIAAVENIV